MTNSQTIKTVIITGGNSCLGFECAKAIAHAHQGWHIVLACRNNEKGMQVYWLGYDSSNDDLGFSWPRSIC